MPSPGSIVLYVLIVSFVFIFFLLPLMGLERRELGGRDKQAGGARQEVGSRGEWEVCVQRGRRSLSPSVWDGSLLSLDQTCSSPPSQSNVVLSRVPSEYFSSPLCYQFCLHHHCVTPG